MVCHGDCNSQTWTRQPRRRSRTCSFRTTAACSLRTPVGVSRRSLVATARAPASRSRTVDMFFFFWLGFKTCFLCHGPLCRRSALARAHPVGFLHESSSCCSAAFILNGTSLDRWHELSVCVRRSRGPFLKVLPTMISSRPQTGQLATAANAGATIPTGKGLTGGRQLGGRRRPCRVASRQSMSGSGGNALRTSCRMTAAAVC